MFIQALIYGGKLTGFIDFPADVQRYLDDGARVRIVSPTAVEYDAQTAVYAWAGGTEPAPTREDVELESDRREAAFISTVLGRKISHHQAQRLIAEGAQEAVELNDKAARRTAKENARADQLRQFRGGLKAIRATRDALAAQTPIPVDFQDAAHWS